ncbi:MAG: histidine phosphatase family protein [Anaerolineae bacterium]|nr:histidine phosphatase family protein [Anaerolineae bacterium]
MTHLVLIRHGQTHTPQDAWFRGQVDVPLDEVGLAQAAATAQRVIAAWTPQAIYSSPLMRARQTAELIAEPLGLVVQVHEGLTDINYGVWQGLRMHEVRARWFKTLMVWNSHPHHASIPGGETLAMVRTRVLKALQEITAAHPHATVIVVAHAVVNRLIMLRALGWTSERFWELQQKNCSLCVVEIDDPGADAYHVALMNDVSHL